MNQALTPRDLGSIDLHPKLSGCMESSSQSVLSEDVLPQALSLIRCLDNPNRLAILCMLVEQPRTVTEMAQAVGLSLSAMSQHLAVLRQAELVATERRQQLVIYRLRSSEARAVVGLLGELFASPGMADQSA